MPHDLQMFLDPPLRGFYTYQDTVSGKVIFESAHEEKIGWVYVFFHGCVNIEFNIRGEESPVYKCMDKEVLFQQCQKVYEGHEKLLEKVRYELPFKFAFRAGRGASSLPTSGKYHFSSVEYKVTAVPRRIGQTEDQIMSMMNPYNPPFPKKPLILSPTRIFLNLSKKTVGVSQQLQFVQVRLGAAINLAMRDPRSRHLDIASHHLQELEQILADLPEEHRSLRRKEHIPFSINYQIPENIVEGVPFTLLLSISSPSALWNHKPAPVTLTSFRIILFAVDAARTGDLSHRDYQMYPIWERKRLNIPLRSKAVNIGQIYSFRVTGDGIVPSFYTSMLQREYDFRIELVAEVGGKSFKVAMYGISNVKILSRNVAAPCNPPVYIMTP